ncbi:hypothetical protein ACR780_02080 [Sphingobacterium faecium]|uniref:hypothetical protein n=1 Tax=Sphingobacterium faecium TaxID=34087 RepID=UPI003DA2E1C9
MRNKSQNQTNVNQVSGEQNLTLMSSAIDDILNQAKSSLREAMAIYCNLEDYLLAEEMNTEIFHMICQINAIQDLSKQAKTILAS